MESQRDRNSNRKRKNKLGYEKRQFGHAVLHYCILWPGNENKSNGCVEYSVIQQKDDFETSNNRWD